MSRAKTETKTPVSADLKADAAASQTPAEAAATKESSPDASAEDTPAKISSSPSAKSAKKEVRAKIYFGDALTGKNYQAGDLIEGWDDDRVALYAERGLVVVSINVGPSEFK